MTTNDLTTVLKNELLSFHPELQRNLNMHVDCKIVPITFQLTPLNPTRVHVGSNDPEIEYAVKRIFERSNGSYHYLKEQPYEIYFYSNLKAMRANLAVMKGPGEALALSSKRCVII